MRASAFCRPCKGTLGVRDLTEKSECKIPGFRYSDVMSCRCPRRRHFLSSCPITG
jgi:hypothetical protein